MAGPGALSRPRTGLAAALAASGVAGRAALQAACQAARRVLFPAVIARPRALILPTEDETVVRAGVPAPATVPQAAARVVPRVVSGLEGLVVLVRPMEAPEQVEGVPLRSRGHPQAANAAVGVGVAARLAALAALEAALPAPETVAGVPPIGVDEVAVQATTGATTGPPAAVAVPFPRAGAVRIAAGGGQATAAAGPATSVFPWRQRPAARPVAVLEGAGTPAVVADVLPRRVAAARAVAWLGGPRLVRAVAGQGTAVAGPVVVVVAVVALGPSSPFHLPNA